LLVGTATVPPSVSHCAFGGGSVTGAALGTLRDRLRNDRGAAGTWRQPVMLRFSMTILLRPMIGTL
jgi:hypothetical protein